MSSHPRKPIVLLAAGLSVVGLAVFFFSRSGPGSDSRAHQSAHPSPVPAAPAAGIRQAAVPATGKAATNPPVPPEAFSAPRDDARPANPAGGRADSMPRPGGDPAETGPWADAPARGVAVEGLPAQAEATVGGRSFELSPNQAGTFQRVYVAPGSRIDVLVRYPGAAGGETLTAHMADGGTVGGRMAGNAVLDSSGAAAFAVEVSANAGTHRVLLRKGADVKVLDFWVGPPLAVRADNFSRQTQSSQP